MPDSIARPSFTPVRGALGLSVAMGMGRFFYTPALPLMVAALHWDSAPGAWIATLNYVGYFIGTLVIAQGWVEPNRFVYRLSLIVSTLGLAAVALTPNLIWQGGIRTIAGIASGLIFVCVTQRIPANSRKPRDGGISYGGVGFGISSPSHRSRRQLRRLAPALAHLRGRVRGLHHHRLDLADPRRSTTPLAGRPTRPRPTPTLPPRSHPSRPIVAEPWPSSPPATSSRAAATSSAPPRCAGRSVFGATAAASTWLIAGIATAASP